jgi:hypothetical protein
MRLAAKSCHEGSNPSLSARKESIMNMFKPVAAKTVSGYIGQLEPERKKLVEFIDKFIKKTVPKLKVHFAYNMLGYGSFKYKNHKKQILDWPIVALASQKNYISLYVCALEDGEYVAEKYKAKLGKVSVGRSCIRFKKLEDVKLDELAKILKKAEKNPGLVKD